MKKSKTAKCIEEELSYMNGASIGIGKVGSWEQAKPMFGARRKFGRRLTEEERSKELSEMRELVDSQLKKKFIQIKKGREQ